MIVGGKTEKNEEKEEELQWKKGWMMDEEHRKTGERSGN